MLHLKDLPILVLGLGTSGLAMARWCLRCGARVRVWDSREQPPGRAALAALGADAALFGGALDAASLGDARLVLKSPGLAPLDPRIAGLLDAAARTGIAVQGELDLFARALAELNNERDYAPQVLALTGTNGKTTTTVLTGLLVQSAGRRVAVAGNVGPTLLDTLGAALDADAALPEVWVLELSSFQLHGVREFTPSAAAVLNVTQDHLDWHGTMADYAADKARVFGAADAAVPAVMVINRDDPLVEAMAAASAPQARPRAARPLPRRVVRFGLDAPQHPGDFGLVVEGGMAWLVRAHEAESGPGRRRDEAPQIHLQRLMPADALRLRGRHNAANALAALALATAIGCPLAPMLYALREYRGEAHRVEPVGSIGGVEFFDDSKGTNVGATVAALLGLGADKAPARLVAILGGDGKGQDFAALAEPVRRYARAVATIGRDAASIEQALQASGVRLERHASLEAAVRWSLAQAQSGDAVLLSPACASLDMFRNYAHRAEVFVAAVRELAAERGEVVA